MSEILSERAVRRVANLARLSPTDREVQTYREQLAAVLAHIDHLARLEVEGVEPMSHPLPLANHLQDDDIEPSLPVRTLLDLAPAVEGSCLAVPKVIGETGG